MNNIKEVDVLVIGAGPAGSMAACESSKNGAKTLIIEKKSEIGAPKRCAEGITLNELKKNEIDVDERWVAKYIEGVKIVSPDNTDVTLNTKDLDVPARGVILERKIFDKHLTMEAIRNGAEVMVKTQSTNMVKEEDGYLVSIKGIDKEITHIKAKIVIGADGPESHVGGWAGLNTTVKFSEMDSGAQYEMVNLDLPCDGDLIEFYFGSVAPGGYAWIFPKGKDIANVGIDVSNARTDKTAIEHLDEFIANCEETKNGQIVEINVGGNPFCGVFDKIVTDNVLLVGDAAGCINPVTGGGIELAIQSGKAAGTIAAKAIKEKNYTEERLNEYSDYIDETIRKKCNKMIGVRDFVYSLDDEEFNKFAKALNDADLKEISYTSLIKPLIKVSPKKLFKLRKVLF